MQVPSDSCLHSWSAYGFHVELPKRAKKKNVNVVSSPTIDAVSNSFTLVGYSDIASAVSC